MSFFPSSYQSRTRDDLFCPDFQSTIAIGLDGPSPWRPGSVLAVGHWYYTGLSQTWLDRTYRDLSTFISDLRTFDLTRALMQREYKKKRRALAKLERKTSFLITAPIATQDF
jgi:hypothetical protein